MTSELNNLDLSIRTLRAVCEDAAAPAAARAQAARTLLEATGHLRSGGADEARRKDLSEMTAEELDREIARLSGK